MVIASVLEGVAAMQRMIRYLVGGLSGALAVIPHAHAGLLGATATFRESLDIPQIKQTGALLLQATGRAIDNTTELTKNDTVSNPSGYQGDLEATLGGATLKLAADLFNDYQTITFSVTNIQGAADIVDFSLTSAGAINTGLSAAFTRTLAFTSNSLSVTYAVNNPGAGDEFYLNPRSFDAFSITTADAAAPVTVPEPASLSLLAIGITSAGVMLRRRRGA
jgi:hypothetical protein